MGSRLAIGIIGVHLLLATFTCGQNSSSSIPRKPSWAMEQAKTTANVAQVSPRIRSLRDKAFDDPDGVRTRLDVKTGVSARASGSFADRGPTDPLPLAASDDVVIARVTGYQSFFSSDHTAIYTELYLNIEKVLKSRVADVAAGSVVTVLKSGGVLSYNGNLLKFPPTASSTEELDMGERYVLFLKSNTKLEAYDDLEAWRLDNDHAVPMDMTQRASSQKDPKLIRFSQFTEHNIVPRN